MASQPEEDLFLPASNITKKLTANYKICAKENRSNVFQDLGYLPPLYFDTLVKIALRHGITVLQSDEVADYELRSASQKYGLPILSCDSDFHVHGVPLIYMKSVDDFTNVVRCPVTKEPFVIAEIFDYADFCKVSFSFL